MNFKRILVLVLLCSMNAFAQIETGTIVGTVTDANEAILPGVKVEIRSVSTGVVTTLTTNDAGRYQSRPLKPDSYESAATRQGFNAAKATLVLEVSQRVGFEALPHRQQLRSRQRHQPTGNVAGGDV